MYNYKNKNKLKKAYHLLHLSIQKQREENERRHSKRPERGLLIINHLAGKTIIPTQSTIILAIRRSNTVKQLINCLIRSKTLYYFKRGLANLG